MSQTRKTLTVSYLNNYVKNMLENKFDLSRYYIKGEISGYKKQANSGHHYFSIKDDESELRCALFKYQAANMDVDLKDGDEVLLSGKLTLFLKNGSYQCIVSEIMKVGQGELYQAYLELKDKLFKEGLFDLKKTLPILPKKVGVITSETGAVIRDIIHVANKRYSNFQLVLYPSSVQGKEASKTLRAGVEFFNKTQSVDVIIIGRGGGSIEDLWCFNDEALARSIANSKIPVVSAVGHETDFTICDFVSDFRAPTPSAAAELVWPDKEMLLYKIKQMQSRLYKTLKHTIDMHHRNLERYRSHLTGARLMSLYTQKQLQLDQTCTQLTSGLKSILATQGERLLKQDRKLESSIQVIYNLNEGAFKKAVSALDAMSPLKVLSRGYAVLMDDKDRVVTSTKSIALEDTLSIQLKDGRLQANVTQIKETEDGR